MTIYTSLEYLGLFTADLFFSSIDSFLFPYTNGDICRAEAVIDRSVLIIELDSLSGWASLLIR